MMNKRRKVSPSVFIVAGASFLLFCLYYIAVLLLFANGGVSSAVSLLMFAPLFMLIYCALYGFFGYRKWQSVSIAVISVSSAFLIAALCVWIYNIIGSTASDYAGTFLLIDFFMLLLVISVTFFSAHLTKKHLFRENKRAEAFAHLDAKERGEASRSKAPHENKQKQTKKDEYNKTVKNKRN